MKHLLIGSAIVAALAISAPVWAQPAPSNPPPGAAAPPPAAPPVQSSNRMPAGGPATSERGLPGSVERAHHRHHATHAHTTHTHTGHAHTGHAARQPSGGNGQADQLNRQELSQLQNGNPTTMNRMPAGGRATSGGPTQ